MKKLKPAQGFSGPRQLICPEVRNAVQMTERLKGFERFQQAVLDAGWAATRPMYKEHKKALSKVLGNHIFDLPGPRTIELKHSERDIFVGKIFQGFLEISNCVEALEDIEFYLGRFPYRNTRITKRRYLQFHVESYLSEVYVLHERLTKYITLIQREYKNDLKTQTCANLLKLVRISLEKVVKVRNDHIHQIRFNDSGIDRLGTLEMLASSSKKELAEAMTIHHRIEYAKIKKYWKKQASEGNASIRRILDVLFDALFPVVFDENTNALKYPRRLKCSTT